MSIYILIHVVSAIMALIVGTLLFFQKRNAYTHYIGYIWRFSAYMTAFSSLTINTTNPSWIHLLSLFVIYSISRGIYMGHKKRWLEHNVDMLGSYIGLWIAFLFTLSPSRALGERLYNGIGIPENTQVTAFYIILIIGNIYTLFLCRKMYKWLQKIKALKNI